MPASPRILRPLRARDYRWLLGSLALSLCSEGLWLVAAVWQVVALGGGPSQVSVVLTASAAGLLVTVLAGGVVADRVPQRTILIAVEAVRVVAIGAAALLSVSGTLELWHLTVVSLAGGCASGMYYPAYSALLPSIVPPKDLLPANGMEGVLRPVVQQALGPAAGGIVVAAISPGIALAASAATALLAGVCAAAIRTRAVRRDLTAVQNRAGSAVQAMLRDLAEGFRYMVATRWFLATLVFAVALVFFVVGPMEVLVPFAVRDRAGGGPADHAMVLAAFGIGGAVASAVMASLPMPRRYLTTMNMMWAIAALPLLAFGLANDRWVMLIAALAVGAFLNAPMVIWGTLLQRRVPPAMLGRASSLDFFVSLLLMPVSMAAAGPVGEAAGLTWTFAIAAVTPVVIGVVVITAFGLARDELEHPLHDDDILTPTPPVVPTSAPLP